MKVSLVTPVLCGDDLVRGKREAISRSRCAWRIVCMFIGASGDVDWIAIGNNKFTKAKAGLVAA